MSGGNEMVLTRSSRIARKPEINTISRPLSSSGNGKGDVNTILERYKECIVASAQKQISRRAVPAEELADEIDDVVQMTLITLWRRLSSEEVHITSLKAYIASVVHSRSVDMIRIRQRHRFVQPLTMEQEDELYQDTVHLISNNGMQDPAFEYRYKELLVEIVNDVLKLPPRQRSAMICVLKDAVEDTALLAEALEQHGIDIGDISWPEDAVALQRLRSSLSIARKKLRTSARHHFT
jgi:RNA polymerase sigma factor (sigma-70 family)